MPNRNGIPNYGTRRDVLQQGWAWVCLAAFMVLCYPLFRFLQFQVPRQARLVKIAKLLPLGGFVLEQDFVLFEGEKGPWAISRKCTHLGCRLNYLVKEQQLVCPCHQSRFLPNGKRVAGPARKDLPIFQVTREEEGKDKGYIVTLMG